MHVQIITFRRPDMTEEGYRRACAGFAPAYAGLPGLLGEVRLADPAANTYGGVYLFRDRAAMNAYVASDLLAPVVAFPPLAGPANNDLPPSHGAHHPREQPRPRGPPPPHT